MKTNMKTKDRILQSSIELFNRQGVVAVTTNHICKALEISPGNLYFHFANKEEIIRSIFVSMCQETYNLWKPQLKGVATPSPLALIEANFEIYWRYRFFHREMYYLRRKDPLLAKLWKSHLAKIFKLMRVVYMRWLREGWMRPIQSPQEVDFVVNVLLATASSFLQFFESAEKLPARRHVEMGKQYLARLLEPWTQGVARQEFADFLRSSSARIPIASEPALRDSAITN